MDALNYIPFPLLKSLLFSIAQTGWEFPHLPIVFESSLCHLISLQVTQESLTVARMIGHMKVSSIWLSKFFGLSSTSWKVQGYGHIQLHSSQHCKEPSVQLLIGISFWSQQNTIYCSNLYQHCIHSLHFLFLTDTRVSSVFSFELPEESSLPFIHSKIDLSVIHFSCHLASMYYQFKSCSHEGKYF